MQEEPKARILKLEGRVAGAWVDELDRIWKSFDGSLGSKRFAVDLRGVTHMDARAIELLSKIYRQTGAEFMANTPMSKYFADEARRRSKRDSEEGN